MVIELDRQCRNPQLKSRSFMTPLILKTNFIKQESKIVSPWVSNWNPADWEPTVITTTPYSTYSIMGSLKVLYTHLQSLGTILETFHFPLTVQGIPKFTASIQNSIKFQQRPTTICLIIYNKT